MEFSRTRFETLVGKLAGEADLQFAPEWLRIGQQKVGDRSVADGFIAQDSIKIVIETKLGANFDAGQLVRHLEIFKGEDYKLLVLLGPVTPQLGAGLEGVQRAAASLAVEILPTTFGKIISTMREVLSERDEDMLALIHDFEDFCRGEQLLADDQFFVFTPPCGPSHKDNEALRLYYCPADRPRRNARYLGIYTNKVVRAIGRIAKVVTCTVDLDHKEVKVLTGGPITAEEADRILEAAKEAPTHGWNITHGHRFYLCDEWAPTNFRKGTPNGIQGHRMLDLRKEFPGGLPSSLTAIAGGLEGREWNQS